MKSVRIRENIPQYMKELKAWLESQEQTPPEEMSSFFTARLGGYEEHMKIWEKAYRKIGGMVPADCGELLDLGCGTGLELDEILKRCKSARVTGIDLCGPMLEKLKEKHPQVRAVRADYFAVPLGENRFDAAVSVESLHHFDPDRKRDLFRKIRAALKDGGRLIECDYIACCDEEEKLLKDESRRKREKFGIAPGVYLHLDRPLTLGHETRLMGEAGFSSVEAAGSVDGATFLVCTK